MKRLAYLVMSVVLLVGCNGTMEDDSYLISNFDPTEPGLILFEQSMKAVCAISGGMVSALNLNAHITAPDEASRLAIEDKYYPYRKVREWEDNQWCIFDQSTREVYHLHEGLTLDEEGAVWTLLTHPKFFPQSNPSAVISRTEEDTFEVTLNRVPIEISMSKPNDLYDYLQRWGNHQRATATVTLSIATNNSLFRSGEASQLVFNISGEGTLYDPAERYSLNFEVESLSVVFDDESGLIMKNSPYVGTINISNSQSATVTAQMTPYNTIVIKYQTKAEGENIGYYDLTGRNISPQ